MPGDYRPFYPSSLLRPIRISSFPYPTLEYYFLPSETPSSWDRRLGYSPQSPQINPSLFPPCIPLSPPILTIIMTRYSSAEIRYEELHNELMVRVQLILKKSLVIDGIKDADYKRFPASPCQLKDGNTSRIYKRRLEISPYKNAQTFNRRG